MSPDINDLIGHEFGGHDDDDNEEDENAKTKTRSGKIIEDEKKFLRENGVNSNGNGKGKKQKEEKKKKEEKQQQQDQENLPSYLIYKYSNKRQGDLYEAIILNGIPIFLTRDTENKIKIVENIQENHRKLRPPDQEEYPYDCVFKTRCWNQDSESIEAMKLAIEHRSSKLLSEIGMPVTNHIND